MKNTLTVVLATFVLLCAKNTNAQAVGQGSNLIDINYGFPNLSATFLNEQEDLFSFAEDVKISSFGPVSIKFEHLVTDRIGVGLEANYASSSISFNEQDGNEIYDYKLSIPRYRLMPKFIFHFPGNNKNFDPYTSISAGYAKYSFTVETNNPNGYDKFFRFNFPKVAFRIAVGTRWYFTDLIGANLEIGVGSGALVGVGFSVRIQ